jgi:hypothetical protein
VSERTRAKNPRERSPKPKEGRLGESGWEEELTNCKREKRRIGIRSIEKKNACVNFDRFEANARRESLKGRRERRTLTSRALRSVSPSEPKRSLEGAKKRIESTLSRSESYRTN